MGRTRETILVTSAVDEARFAGMGFAENRRKIGSTIHVRIPPRFYFGQTDAAIRAINLMPFDLSRLFNPAPPLWPVVTPAPAPACRPMYVVKPG